MRETLVGARVGRSGAKGGSCLSCGNVWLQLVADRLHLTRRCGDAEVCGRGCGSAVGRASMEGLGFTTCVAPVRARDSAGVAVRRSAVRGVVGRARRARLSVVRGRGDAFAFVEGVAERVTERVAEPAEGAVAEGATESAEEAGAAVGGAVAAEGVAVVDEDDGAHAVTEDEAVEVEERAEVGERAEVDERAEVRERAEVGEKAKGDVTAGAVSAPPSSLDTMLETRRAANVAAKRTRGAGVSVARRKKESVVTNGSIKDPFQAYMDEISREELLCQGEVVALATRIKEGVAVEDAEREMAVELGRRPSVPELAERLACGVADVQKRRMAGTAAKNALVAANLRLVTSVARKVGSTKGTSTAGIALDDMIQEGSVGLIRAAEKFDATRGYKFSTYATWWIRAFVMRSISTQSRTIKIPSTIVDEYSRIRKEYARLGQAGTFVPSDDDVASALGITSAKLRFVVQAVTRVPTSLDLNVSSGMPDSGSRTLGEVIEGGDNLEERMVEEMQRRELDAALRTTLKPLERAVVRLRFGLDDGHPRTLREVGEVLGLSKERIRQLIFRALPKLKTAEVKRVLTSVLF